MAQSTDHEALHQRVQISLDRQRMMWQLGIKQMAVAPDGQRSDCAVMQQTIVPVPGTS